MNPSKSKRISASAIGLACVLLLATNAPVISADATVSRDGVWTQAERGPDMSLDAGVQVASIRGGHEFALNNALLTDRLADAPLEFTGIQGIELSLPMPDGLFARFRVVRSPILSTAMAARWPQIETYSIQGIDDPTETGRFDRTTRGFHALIVSPKRTVIVEPVVPGDTERCISYDANDLMLPPELTRCDVTSMPAVPRGRVVAAPPSGDELRTYRTAIAITGELYDAYGDNLAAVVADVVSILTMVNAIYEKEVAIHFRLIGVVAYTDPASDPFTDPTSNCANASATTGALNDAFGADEYDFGHSFHLGGGGCMTGVTCGATKGHGSSAGCFGPGCLAGFVEIMLHEGGHQFNAPHTWSAGPQAGCPADQRNCDTAVEPFGGATIMSYAGACGGPRPGGRILFFHTISFDNITDFRDGASTCGTSAKTGNTPPTVDAGPDFTIPRSTAFKLTAVGGDADGDAITYSWEQVDVAPLCALPPYDEFGPIYFSDVPTVDPSRTFLPEATVDRIFTFRCTVRDDRAAGGGVNYDGMVLTVAGDPFAVTAPNGGEVLRAGCETTVTWTVGGGSVAANVNILLSTNGGLTFPTVLAANVPNDGVQSVDLPCIAFDADCRVRVEAVDNVFFDDSDANFTIRGEAPQVANRSGFEDAEVNTECVALVPFDVTFEDDCGMDDDDVTVQAVSVDGRSTVAVVDLLKTQLDASRVRVSGTIRVSDLTACPAEVRAVVLAADLCGFESTFEATFEVTDPIPPQISLELNREFLWPPNHHLADIEVDVTVTDNCPGVSYALTSVVSNEPEDGLGDGDTAPDIVGASYGSPDTEFQLRSERSGKESGRIYTITYTASDGCGNSTTALAYVRVAHDQTGHAMVAFGMSEGTIDPSAGSVVFVVPSLALATGTTGDALTTEDHGTTSPIGIPSTFDAGRIAARSAVAGNTKSVVEAKGEATEDVTGDGLVDRIIVFPAVELEVAMAAAGEAGSPIGLHYVMRDGESFLVPDIRTIPQFGSLAQSILDQLGVREAIRGAYAIEARLPTDHVPQSTSFSGVRPNPFVGSTAIAFDLARAAKVRLAVYDAVGRVVAVLIEGERQAGQHRLVWDGRDTSGLKVRPGIYFVRFDGDGVIASRKAIFMQ